MTDLSRPLATALCVGALLAILTVSPGMFAEESQAPQSAQATDQSAEQTAEETTETQLRLPPVSVTAHRTTLGGEDVPYSAAAGAVVLNGKDGKPKAEIFYVGYSREPKDSGRPVTFVFNGGPGAASAYLHLGALGPRVSSPVWITRRTATLGVLP